MLVPLLLNIDADEIEIPGGSNDLDVVTTDWDRVSARMTQAEVLAMLVGQGFLSASFDTSYIDPFRRYHGILAELRFNRGLFDTTYGTNEAWDDDYGGFRSPLKSAGSDHYKPWEVDAFLRAAFEAAPIAFLTQYVSSSRATELVGNTLITSTSKEMRSFKAACLGTVALTEDEGFLFSIDGCEIVWSGPTCGYVTSDAASTTSVAISSLTDIDGKTDRMYLFGSEDNSRWPYILLQDDNGGSLRITAGTMTIDFTSGVPNSPSTLSANDTLVGGTSGAQAVVVSTTSQTAGTITLANWNGVNFSDGETITVSGQWTGTYTAASQVTSLGDIDHYREGDRVRLITTAITGHTGCQIANITNMDAANDRFTTDIAYDDRDASANRVGNCFYLEHGVAMITAIDGSTHTLQTGDLTQPPRKNQIVASPGASGNIPGRGPESIAAFLAGTPVGHRVLRSTDLFCLPAGVGTKGRYGDAVTFGTGRISYDKHIELLPPLISQWLGDIKAEMIAMGETDLNIDFVMDVEGGVYPGFFQVDGPEVLAQLDAELASEDIGFDVDADGYTIETSTPTVTVGTTSPYEDGEKRSNAITAANYRHWMDLHNAIHDVFKIHFPDGNFSNFRNGPRVPWKSATASRTSASAGNLHPGGGRFDSEGQAPQRLTVPAEGSGSLLDVVNDYYYLPEGADGDGDDLAWLQTELCFSRLNEMVLSSARGVGMWIYKFTDSQCEALQNHELYDDVTAMCLAYCTQPTIGFANAATTADPGENQNDQDLVQAVMKEVAEAIPYDVRTPVPLEYPRGQIFGNAYVRFAIDAGGAWTWYFLPKPGASVLFIEQGDNVRVVTLAPYEESFTLYGASILSIDAQVTSGTWIRQQDTLRDMFSLEVLDEPAALEVMEYPAALEVQEG